MVDMNAFERQVAGEVNRAIGPVQPVDDLAVFNAVITAAQSPKWRFQSMFSATKFAIAGAIVALFGGFLLAGVLTQQPSDEHLPAVGASASPTVQSEPTDAATSEPEPTTSEADDATTPDLLPGVDLDVEEVEPGVFRIVGDGVRDLSWPADRTDLYLNGVLGRQIVAGRDGSVWLFWPDKAFRLGSANETRWGTAPPLDDRQDFDVAADGRVYWVAASGEPAPLRLLADGGEWRNVAGGEMLAVAITPDGAAWGVFPRTECQDNRRLRDARNNMTGWCASYLHDAEWYDDDLYDGVPVPVPRVSDVIYGGIAGLWSTADGALWLLEKWPGEQPDPPSLVRYDGDGFDRFDVPSRIGQGHWYDDVADMNAAGVLWVQDWQSIPDGTLYRFDGSGWTTYGEADGVPQLGTHYQGHTGFLAVSPDGSVWVNPLGDFDSTGSECGGIANFDGQRWTHHLRDHCIYGIDIASDGSVWLQA